MIKYGVFISLFLAASFSNAATVWVTNHTKENICFLVQTKSPGKPECLASGNVKPKFINTGLNGFEGVKWWLGTEGSTAEPGKTWIANQAVMKALQVQGKLALFPNGNYDWKGVRTTGQSVDH